MPQRQAGARAPGPISCMLAAVQKQKAFSIRMAALLNPSGASTAPSVMKHIACGAGAATERSSKGGKSGGGMGGQRAGGVKGGGKRKTHAGRK